MSELHVPCSAQGASTEHAGGPRLLADVGGTNARFALEKAPGLIGDVRVYPCSRFAGINEAISAYLAEVCRVRVRHAAIAIANPVDDDMVRMTNHDWCFSIEATRRALDLDVLRVVNDFTALAMAVPYFSEARRRQVGGGTQRRNGTIGVLGAGTGLGVSGLIPGREHWIPLSGEGGHITFAPIDERDIDILKFAWKTWPHVSFERLAAGPGIEMIDRALAARAGRPASAVFRSVWNLSDYWRE